VRLKCDGTRAETRFRLSAKRTSPFKSARGRQFSRLLAGEVRVSGSNAGYTTYRGSVKSTGFPLHSPVSPPFPPPVRHRVPSGFKSTLLAKALKSIISLSSTVVSISTTRVKNLQILRSAKITRLLGTCFCKISKNGC